MNTKKLFSFPLCCYTSEKAEYNQKAAGYYRKVLNYLEVMRFHYGDDATFICGYEDGCLGFTLYHQCCNAPWEGSS